MSKMLHVKTPRGAQKQYAACSNALARAKIKVKGKSLQESCTKAKKSCVIQQIKENTDI